MKHYPVPYFKGQLKMQEMAFVLIAIFIFFVIVALFFIKIKLSDLQKSVIDQREEKASELALKLADSAEFSFSSANQQCENCVDFDKLLALKESMVSNSPYNNFWSSDITAIKIDFIYPQKKGECNRANYPNCKTITLMNKTADYNYRGGYVAVCRRNYEKSGGIECGLGRILVSAKFL